MYGHDLDTSGVSMLQVLVEIMIWTGDGVLVGILVGGTTNTIVTGEVYVHETVAVLLLFSPSLTLICQ